jgi:hypothetical protein
MSIEKYTNFDRINQKLDNEGKFLQDKDSVIISNNQIEDTDFGDCKYDVMEVSVYDINNNLLPQKSGNTVAYIKTGDIKNYLFNITNNRGKKELAIDIEKLLESLGFKNGILRVNINFVRNRIGTDDSLRRVWVQEISPTRSEIRILPLKVVDENVTNQNISDFNNLQNLNKDFKYYKKAILDSLYSFENTFLDSINNSLESKYGKDFFNILKKDFGLRDFAEFRKRIYEDFKTSVDYYLNNKYYWINDGNYGKSSPIRFEDCEQYEFDMIIKEMEDILFRCVEVNTAFLKRRDFDIEETPKQFKQVELSKQIQDNVGFFETPIKKANIVYSPEDVTVIPTQPPPTVVSEQPPPPTPIPPKIEFDVIESYFSYFIKNNSSLRSLVFKFTDVSGATVEKNIPAGGTTTVCALENSISVNETTAIRRARPLFSPLNRIFEKVNKLDYSINRLKMCKTKDIGDGAPVLVEPVTLPPKVKAPVASTGGGGVTREEAAASTNQIITPRGPAISTATAAGMSQELPSALQPRTRTDVRQTSITGPVID